MFVDRKIIFVVLFIFSLITVLAAQRGINRSGTLAVLPFQANGINQASVNSAQILLEGHLSAEPELNILSAQQLLQSGIDQPCAEVDCAVNIGQQINAGEVLMVSLSRLGQKIIVQYRLVKVASQSISLIDQATSMSVEDLENVIKRVAKSLVTGKPFQNTVEVGTVTAKESTLLNYRAAKFSIGGSFGYLYPTRGYNGKERSFSIDGRLDYETENWAAGGIMGIREGFNLSLYSSYFLTKTDFSPFIGGGMGFHWVAHDDFWKNNDKREDGFELILNTGVRAFRTYNFNLFFNLDYAVTFNDYNDKAFIFTMGMLISL